jgi:putative inorganic carbon (HCO3(-)) transporter
VNERLAFNRGPGARAVRRLRRNERPTYLSMFRYDAGSNQGSSIVEGQARVRVAAQPEWDWRGLLGFTTVLFLRPQDHVPAMSVLHPAELFAIFAIIALLLGRLARRLPPVHITPEIIALTAFGGAVLIGLPFSIWPGGVMSVFTGIYLKLLVIFVLMVTVLSRAQRIEQFAFLVVVFSGYIASRAVFDYARGVNLVEDGRVAGAIGGIFGNPNDLALNMVVFLPFALLFALKPGPALWRGLAAGSALAMLATIVMTKSRGGAVGLVVMLMVLVVRSIRVRPAIAAGTLTAVLVALPFAPSSFWSRMVSIVHADRDPTGSRQARIDLLEESWEVFKAYPIFGVGLGQFENYNPPGRKQAWRVSHNAVLQVAAETGMVGLVPFVFLLVSGALAARTARRALLRKHRRVRPGPAEVQQREEPSDPTRDSLILMTTAVTPSLVGWFICAQFASVALNWTFYYVLAIAVAIREVAVASAATRATARVAA